MTQSPTPEELEGLLERATQRPWKGEDVIRGGELIRNGIIYPDSGYEIAYDINEPTDAALIVAAVNALPDLLSRIRAQDERIRGLEEALENIDCAAAVSHNGTETRTLTYILEVTKGILDPARAAPADGEGELRPCPFCAATLSEPTLVRGTGQLFRFHPGVVTDKDCILAGKGFGGESLAAWNRRTFATRAENAQVPHLGDREAIAREILARALQNAGHVNNAQLMRNGNERAVRISGTIALSALLSFTPSPAG